MRRPPPVAHVVVHISFAHSIQRHVECPSLDVEGDTLRDVLEAVFQNNETLRSYVLDDQGSLRKHLAVFVDGQQITDPFRLSDAVPPDANVHVIQALSGG